MTRKKSGTAGGLLVQLGHEAVHQYLHLANGPLVLLPTWLDEFITNLLRLRELVSTVSAIPCALNFCAGLMRSRRHWLYLLVNRFVRVHHYAEVYVMVHHLLEDSACDNGGKKSDVMPKRSGICIYCKKWQSP